MAVERREVGRLVALFRHPVKAMRGEALREADVAWQGVAGDRRWAFIREGQEKNGFPWLTLRDRPELARYEPSFVEPARPDASPVVVRAPSGASFDVADPALAAELGAGVRVIKQDRGVFDTLPLSIITTQTIASLAALAHAELDVRRFRPSFVIDATGDAFPEDAWVGRVLAIGGVRVRVDKRDQRCVVINVDPTTTTRNAEILRAVARERQACLGVYGTTVQPGRVAVGDAVFVEE